MLSPTLVRWIALVVLIVWPINLAVEYVWHRGEPLVNVIFMGVTGSIFVLQKKTDKRDPDGDS